jgi:hypothetical protein
LAVLIGVLLAGAVFAAPRAARALQEAFPHAEHANMFPLCTTCHAGIVEQGQPVWPNAAGCASCHDGVVEARVEWAPPADTPDGNLRFTHPGHATAVATERPADTVRVADCGSCHTESGAPRMAVQHAVVGQCIDCHGFQQPHVDVPSVACATCHVRLTDAPGLTRTEIAAFPEPSSHDDPAFLLTGHGQAAKGPGAQGPTAVAASCATCHARNLCLACHVNAPESPVIQALALDPRPPVYAGLAAPPSHAAPNFLRAHGREAQRSTATCATCHTRQSCTTCHVGAPPRSIAALPAPSADRAVGAHVTREAPPSHTWDFREHHGAEASARPQSCETCHARSMCLECHRPQGATEVGYHSPNFLTRHPSAAYTRDANCSDCHNVAQFCQDCHQQSGLVADSRIGQAGYHDAFRGFSLGHGQAARQSLESCAGCHAERDCTACHSAVGGGFRFSPHGPGFNAAQIRSKNPSVCIACHGRTIPGGQ